MNRFLMRFMESAMLWCGAQPALGPTFVEEAYSKRSFASLICQGLMISLLVKSVFMVFYLFRKLSIF